MHLRNTDTERGGLTGEDVIVDETSVDGKDAHQQNDVATKEEGVHDLFAKAAGVLLLNHDEASSGEGNEDAVANVTKHDSKEEREGDDGEETGVDFLVRGDAVRINDGLEAGCELVDAVKGGRVFGIAELVQDGRDGGAVELSSATEGHLDRRDVAAGDPRLSHERASTSIGLEAVHGVVDELLFADEAPPGRDGLGNGEQLSLAGGIGVGKNGLEVLDASNDFAKGSVALVGSRVDGIEGAAEGVCNLANLLKELLAVCEPAFKLSASTTGTRHKINNTDGQR